MDSAAFDLRREHLATPTASRGERMAAGPTTAAARGRKHAAYPPTDDRRASRQRENSMNTQRAFFVTPKPLEVVPIAPPPEALRRRRDAQFAEEGAKSTRYTLPETLQSSSPVGYRHRVALDQTEAAEALELLALHRPTQFVPNDDAITERELFEEHALGVLSARQSTNYRGHRVVTLGPEDSARVTEHLSSMDGLEARVHDKATHTHLVFSRDYRTPFTLLLTFIGHQPFSSLWTVAKRAWEKRFRGKDDIPTIGYLQHIHLGVLADAMERAAVISSGGRRAANTIMRPFCGTFASSNVTSIRAIEALAGEAEQNAGARDMAGWRLGFVVQVGQVDSDERPCVRAETLRKMGANLLAFRSERILPGVNAEEKAPAQYHVEQGMDVPDDLTVMCGRAAYNAFAHWTGVDRERSKELLLLERVDVLTPDGERRINEIRAMLNSVTEKVVSGLPLWADLPTGRALSRNTQRGKKAFALAGQRIYIGGLDRSEIEREGIEWTLALRAFGASAARSALFAELMGVVDLPTDCDLLAGICLMAGPVNQNDIGKEFFGGKDMLQAAFPHKDPTSLLVWTLKAKTISDPIGNEEQLMNPAQKGALVDLRPGPHDVAFIRNGGRVAPLRSREGRVNGERAFADVDNFVTDPDGREIPGNRGSQWPQAWRDAAVW